MIIKFNRLILSYNRFKILSKKWKLLLFLKFGECQEAIIKNFNRLKRTFQIIERKYQKITRINFNGLRLSYNRFKIPPKMSRLLFFIKCGEYQKVMTINSKRLTMIFQIKDYCIQYHKLIHKSINKLFKTPTY
jgi:hypothetical protein